MGRIWTCLWAILVVLLCPAFGDPANAAQRQPEERNRKDEVLAESTFTVVNPLLLNDFDRFYNLFHQTEGLKELQRTDKTYKQFKTSIRDMVNNYFTCRSKTLRKAFEMHAAYERHLYFHSVSPTELLTAFYVQFLSLRNSLSFLNCLYEAKNRNKIDEMNMSKDIAWYLIGFADTDGNKLHDRMATLLEENMDENEWLRIKNALESMKTLVSIVKKYRDDTRTNLQNPNDWKKIKQWYNFDDKVIIDYVHHLDTFFTRLLFGQENVHREDLIVAKTTPWESRMWLHTMKELYYRLCNWNPTTRSDDLSKEFYFHKKYTSNVVGILHHIEEARLMGTINTYKRHEQHAFLQIALMKSYFQAVIRPKTQAHELEIQFKLQSFKKIRMPMRPRDETQPQD